MCVSCCSHLLFASLFVIVTYFRFLFVFVCNEIIIIGTLSKAAGYTNQKPNKKCNRKIYTVILVRWTCDWEKKKRETNYIKENENEIIHKISNIIIADNNIVLKFSWCCVGTCLYIVQLCDGSWIELDDKKKLLTFARCFSFVSLIKWRFSERPPKRYGVWLCW